MKKHHTKECRKAKVALTIDAELLQQVDTLVSERRFRNRSQAVEPALVWPYIVSGGLSQETSWTGGDSLSSTEC